jgi:hypothetical protein
MNLNLILVILYAWFCLQAPPWVGLDLLSTYVLTIVLLTIFLEEDPDYIPEDVE